MDEHHYEPREKVPIELGFVNEHVTFTDEESDHDDEREVNVALKLFITINLGYFYISYASPCNIFQCSHANYVVLLKMYHLSLTSFSDRLRTSRYTSSQRFERKTSKNVFT